MPFKKRTLVSVIVPVHNEEPNISLLHEQLAAVAGSLPQKFEFIFVDDGSTDGSIDKINGLEAAD
jgi:polyisoprenyl-phosphate glycosyltransferase